MLAEHIEAEPYRNRNLAVVLDKWDFQKGGNIVLDIERLIDSARFVGIVVSRAMLNAEWPTLERSIAVWSDPSGALGRVIPLLRGNVTLPATLRVRNWIDFRDDNKFPESFAELLRLLKGEPTPRGKGSFLPSVPVAPPPYEPAPFLITSSVEADRVDERLLSNLYRVTSMPLKVFHAPTKLREKKEINEYCENAPPFILRDGELYTFCDLNTSDTFRSALSNQNAQFPWDKFTDWFSDEEYRRRAMELLNVCLKAHAWKRHLRFDRTRNRYFSQSSDNKPVRIRWRIGGRRRTREVTTRHTRKVKQDDGEFKEEAF